MANMTTDQAVKVLQPVFKALIQAAADATFGNAFIETNEWGSGFHIDKEVLEALKTLKDPE